ncbi:hypothetical protein BGW80DRAFT_1292531, partial [Lactifluus volemus]
MAVVPKKIRLYIFVLKLISIPTIAVARSLAIKIDQLKCNKFLGNAMDLVGVVCGVPITMRSLHLLLVLRSRGRAFSFGDR